jgi:hypothetical protein
MSFIPRSSNSTSFLVTVLTVKFKNEDHTFKFPYHSPLEWLIDVVTDSSLAQDILWYPIQKYLCKGNKVIRMYDEPVTGKMWWEAQV